MSINCLLTNDVVLDKLVALVDAKSGNVSSVAGVLPIVVAPSAGDVVVSLPIAGTWTATNNVVKSTAPTVLEWGTDGGGGGGGITTATLPLVVVGSDVSLPIAGTWSLASNVVKSSAPTVLEWGVDGTTPTPTFSTQTCLVIGNPWFDAIDSGGAPSNIPYNQVIVAGVSTTYTLLELLVDLQLATGAITAMDVPSFTFNLPTPFQLIGTYSYPASGVTDAGANFQVYVVVSPIDAVSSLATVNFGGLVCVAGAEVDINMPSFTLYNGM